MSQRRFYAHWLDGEIMHPRCVVRSELVSRWRKIVGLLKMHAIFGDCICLSDVQLIDSRVLLWLFSQADFRIFLEQNPSFFRLVGRPTDKLDLGTEKLAIVGAGLGRSLNESWISSTFDPPQVTTEFAEAFKGLKNEGEARWALTNQKGPFKKLVESYSGPEKDLLAGMVQALYHFAVRVPDKVEPPQEKAKSLSYYEVLQKARDEHGLDMVSNTLSFVENNAANKYQRSPAVVAFENAGLDHDGNRVKYLNVIQAWNMGVSSTVNAEYDSVFSFRQVYPLPLLLGPISEFTDEIPASIGDRDLFESIDRVTWHPADLSWLTVAEVTDKCCQKILAYQDSIGGPKSEANFRALVSSVSSVVARQVMPAQKILDWMEINCESTRYFAGVLGHVPSGEDSSKELLSTLENIGEMAAETIRTLKAAKKLSEWIKAARTAEAIQTFAIRYNIHRPPPLV